METKHLLSLFLLCLLAGWYGLPAQAGTAVHYVSTDGNCGIATPCYDTIQTAVNAASAGDTVKIAAGTYTINVAPPTPVVSLTKAVTLLGGFTAQDWETADFINNETILDAQGIYNRRVIDVNVNSSTPLSIAGLTIRGGNGDSLINFDGGGLLWQAGNGTIRDNRFTMNEANHGGGLYLVRGVVDIVENSFEQNNAQRGAGLWVNGATRLSVHDNLFLGNQARTGAGALLTGQIHFFDNELLNNEATNSALFIGQLDMNSLPPQVTVENNLFEDNEGGFGGALHLYDGETAVLDNTFTNNLATQVGGAIYIISRETSTLRNNRFFANGARIGSGSSGGGSALYIYQGTVILNGNQYYDSWTTLFDFSQGEVIRVFLGNVEASNEIIANGEVREEDGTGSYSAVRVEKGTFIGHHLTLANSGEFAVRNEEGFVLISNSILSGQETAAFEGNITSNRNLFHNSPACAPSATCTDSLNGDPQFVNSANNDFHISPNSPAANAAIASILHIDFEGDKRPSGPASDLGADEYLCAAPVQNLWVSNAAEENNMLSATLTWSANSEATAQTLRWSSAPITSANWASATLLTDSLTGTDESYSFSIPFDGSPVYFALRYSAACGESDLSNGTFWPRYDLFLPITTR